MIRCTSSVHNGIYDGSRSALMEIRVPIPSRVSIAHEICFIFYKGQPLTCFRCREQGHISSVCPRT